MPPYVITAADRALFKQCRRAWDFGALGRQRLEDESAPERPAQATVTEALLEALAVYYFPGMWDWGRPIVVPLAHQALDRSWARAGTSEGPDRDRAHDVLDAYAAWAPEHDRFLPIEVAIDLTVLVPDPVLDEEALVTQAGAAVRYECGVDAVVFVTDDARPWLLCHRLSDGPAPDEHLAALDEAALTACWAWEHTMLDTRTAGILLNQIDLRGGDGAFRRLEVPHERRAVADAGRTLGREALDMIDPGLPLYPNPAVSHCRRCPFVAPCRAQRDGRDPVPELSGFRHRPEPVDPGSISLGARLWPPGRR